MRKLCMAVLLVFGLTVGMCLAAYACEGEDCGKAPPQLTTPQEPMVIACESHPCAVAVPREPMVIAGERTGDGCYAPNPQEPMVMAGGNDDGEGGDKAPSGGGYRPEHPDVV